MGHLLKARTLFGLQLLKSASLSLLLAGLASVAMSARSPVRDADVWWHLKVGEWILSQHQFPHVGIFSRTAATRPWIAYSWGYEVLLAKFYSWFGLMGIAWYGVILLVAVAGVLFWALYRLSGRFWLACVLCATASLACLFNVLPRPVFFSMMLFTLVLTILVEAHQQAQLKFVVWLPLLFALWANLHIQFVYGLVVLAIFTGLNACSGFVSTWRLGKLTFAAPRLPRLKLGYVFLACVAASCIGPYTFHLFEVVFGYASAKFPYEFLQEFQSVDFRHPSDYFLATLTLGALFVIFRRKTIDLFQITVLVFAIILTWRGVRDAWVLAISAAAFLATAEKKTAEKSATLMRVRGVAVTSALLVCFLILISVQTRFNERELDRAVSLEYPVDAVNFLRRNPFPGPLYNDFGWGGFLIWYMPDHAVSIDGRTDLYGDEMDLMSLKSVSGDYQSDPFLREAGVILLPKETPLSQLLINDQRFKLVFQNPISVVFVRNENLPH
jgi:hypothetical protein